jgi:hypothetical protein
MKHTVNLLNAIAALPADRVELGVKLCAVLNREAQLYAAENAPLIRLEDAVFTRINDRANNDLPGYMGEWRDAHAQKHGSLLINSDGSYYAEFDLLIPHPRKPQWFIEAITVWGRDGVMKAEPRLLAVV